MWIAYTSEYGKLYLKEEIKEEPPKKEVANNSEIDTTEEEKIEKDKINNDYQNNDKETEDDTKIREDEPKIGGFRAFFQKLFEFFKKILKKLGIM